MNSTKKMLLILSILVFFISITMSYAFFQARVNIKNGTDVSDVTGGALNNSSGIELINITDGINLQNTFPMTYDQTDTMLDPYTFQVKNKSLSNKVMIQIILETKNDNEVSDDLVSASMSSKRGALTNTNVFTSTEPTQEGYSHAYVLYTGSIEKDTTETYNLKVWFNDRATNDGGTNDIQNKSWEGKIVVKAGNNNNDTYDSRANIINPNAKIKCIDSTTEEQILCNNVTTGTKLKIGTEKFYVISNNAGTIRALAEYNLNVGNIYNSSWTKTGEIQATDEGYGLQNSSAIGWRNDINEYRGTVAFYSGEATSSVAYTAYNIDGTTSEIAADTGYTNYAYSDIKTYVDAYLTTLNEPSLADGLVISADLITFRELIALGCNASSSTCKSALNWVYTSGYWSRSASDSSHVWRVDSTGCFADNWGINTRDNDSGVRPVIVLSESSLQ